MEETDVGYDRNGQKDFFFSITGWLSAQDSSSVRGKRKPLAQATFTPPNAEQFLTVDKENESRRVVQARASFWKPQPFGAGCVRILNGKQHIWLLSSDSDADERAERIYQHV